MIQGARIAGAGMIIAIDVNQNRLDMAQHYGATHLLLADPADEGLSQAAEKVRAMTNGRGVDYAFECTAIPALGAAPLAMMGVFIQRVVKLRSLRRSDSNESYSLTSTCLWVRTVDTVDQFHSGVSKHSL